MRGAFSQELESLRGELLTLTSLIELELDFSEEEVEFADREQFRQIDDKIHTKHQPLSIADILPGIERI